MTDLPAEGAEPGKEPAPAAKPAEAKPEASEAKPAAAEQKPEAAAHPAAAEHKPVAAEHKPAPEKPASAGAAPEAKAAAAKPAGKPAHTAVAPPPEDPVDMPIGPFGSFLKDHGISSKRLGDHSGGIECIEVAGEDLEATVKRLRNSPETQLNYLLTISGTEWPEHFESVYHLWSYVSTKELVLKVRIKKDSVAEGKLPVVPSLANFWGAANWHERETFDLVGIRYSGHPYMRRILNPWDWDGHPIRRDYKQPIDALNDKNPDSMR